jgi:hypothetical protein
MKVCSIQRCDKNRDVIGIYMSVYPNFLKSFIIMYSKVKTTHAQAVWLCFILLVCTILFTMGAAIQCFGNLPNNIENCCTHCKQYCTHQQNETKPHGLCMRGFNFLIHYNKVEVFALIFELLSY